MWEEYQEKVIEEINDGLWKGVEYRRLPRQWNDKLRNV